jgi:hypothetical protein
VFGEFHGIDRELDIHVALHLAAALASMNSLVALVTTVMARPVVTPRPPMLRAIRKRSFSLTTFGAWSAMINSTSSAAALAETVGLCWSHWYLAIRSSRPAATMV